MKKHRFSRKFAVMFLNAVGVEGGQKALEELALVTALTKQSDDFRSLMVSPLFSLKEKQAAIGAVGKRLGLGGQTIKFLDFLMEQHAATALPEVLRIATEVYADRIARVTAKVITPSEIGTQYDARLKKALARITARDVEIEYEVDPSLIGGMLIKVGSTMLDGSLKGQLQLLREELIKG